MRSLPARTASLQHIQETLCLYIEEIGVNEAAGLIGVSTDTVRRRMRGEQPWFFNEVLDLAREQLGNKHLTPITDALSIALQGELNHDFRPLRIPSELRGTLRLVGRLTTDIAEALDDGKIDAAEAASLLELFAELDTISAQLRNQLRELVKSEQGRA